MQSIAALLPVFVLIGLGYTLNRLIWKEDNFWASLEKINYYTFFPCFLFLSVTRVSASSFYDPAILLSLGFWCITQLMIFSAVGKAWRLPEISRASFIQTGIRWNTYIGFAVAGSLFGQEGSESFIHIISLAIIFFNIITEIILHRALDKADNLKAHIINLIRNPSIASCLLGIIVVLSGIIVPQPVKATLGLLSQAALPLGLVALGAGMGAAMRESKELNRRNISRGVISIGVIAKLLISPAIMWAACLWGNLEWELTRSLVLFAALPGAPVVFIQVKRAGGDHGLVATVICYQTFVSAFTLATLGILLAG